MAFRELKKSLPAALGVVGSLFSGYTWYKHSGQILGEVQALNNTNATAVLPHYEHSTTTQEYIPSATLYEVPYCQSSDGSVFSMNSRGKYENVVVQGASFEPEKGSKQLGFHRQVSTGLLSWLQIALGFFSFFMSIILKSGFLTGVTATTIFVVAVFRLAKIEAVLMSLHSVQMFLSASSQYHFDHSRKRLSRGFDAVDRENSSSLFRSIITAVGLACIVTSIIMVEIPLPGRFLLMIVGIFILIWVWNGPVQEVYSAFDQMITTATRSLTRKLFEEQISPSPSKIASVPKYLYDRLRNSNAELSVRNRRLEGNIKREAKGRVDYQKKFYRLEDQQLKIKEDALHTRLNCEAEISKTATMAQAELIRVENDWKRHRGDDALLRKQIVQLQRAEHDMKTAVGKSEDRLGGAVAENKRLTLAASNDLQTIRGWEDACQAKDIAMTKAMEDFKVEKDSLSADNNKLKHEQEEFQHQKDELTQEKQKLEGEKRDLDAKVKNLSDDSEKLCKDKDDLKALTQSLEREKADLETRVNTLETEKKSKDDQSPDSMDMDTPEITKLQAKEDELTQLKTRLENETAKSTTLSEEVKQVKQELSDLSSSSNAKIQGLEDLLMTTDKQMTEAKQTVETRDEQLATTTAKLEEAERTAAETKTQLVDEQQRVANANQIVEAKSAEIKETEENMQIYADDLMRATSLLYEMWQRGLEDVQASVVLEKITVADSRCRVLKAELLSPPVRWGKYAEDFKGQIEVDEIAALDNEQWEHLRQQAALSNTRLHALREIAKSARDGRMESGEARRAAWEQLLALGYVREEDTSEEDNTSEAGSSNAPANSPNGTGNSNLPGLFEDPNHAAPVDLDELDTLIKVNNRQKRAPRSRRAVAAGRSNDPTNDAANGASSGSSKPVSGGAPLFDPKNLDPGLFTQFGPNNAGGENSGGGNPPANSGINQ